MMASNRNPSRFVFPALLTAAGLTLAWSLPLAATPLSAGQKSHSEIRMRRIAPAVLLVRHATIWTQGPDGVLQDADLLIRNGKVAAVGTTLEAPRGATIIDARGKHVTPGLIDCHSHTAIRGGVNEGSNNITAEVRIRDALDADDINIYRQLAGGLTVAHTLHGSANAIGGQDAVIKLRWHRPVAELPMDGAWPGIKFALGENPKRSNFRRPGLSQRYPATRMGVMESIRARFLAARDYMRRWDEYNALSRKKQAHHVPPRRDLQLEALAEVLRGERLVHSHSYRQDEILALMRVAEEFGFRIATFQHVLEGYKVADELAAHGAGASTFSDWWAYKLEAYDAIPYNGALMHQRGVVVSFNSDSSELARRMNLEAAKAVKYGRLDEVAALDFNTLNPAKQLRIDHRVGSLEAGKDADFVIWRGHPLSVYSIAEQTWVDGVREFDRQADLEARGQLAAERAELIDRVRHPDKKAEKEVDGLRDAGHSGQAAGSQAPVQARSGPQSTQTSARTAGTEPKESVSHGPQPAPRPRLYTDRRAGTSGAFSIVHATVHTISSGIVHDGTVSFQDGRIVALGTALPPLPGARLVDAAGRDLYPGLIDANTALGLTEISSVAGSVDIAETGDINPDIHTAISVNPDSELLSVTRANGLTHVLSAPAGGMVSGFSTLIRLDGWTWEDLAASRDVALHIHWPSFQTRRFSFFGPPASEEDQKKQRQERLKKIRKLFQDARAYARVKASQGHGGKPFDSNPVLEALLPVLDGTVPVILHASEIRQLRSALEWAAKEKIRIIIAGNGDVWRVAETLHRRKIPVILTSVLDLPARRDEPYDAAYTVAAKLDKAGVLFCISSSGSGFGAAMTRNLPYHAAMAAAFGLPKEKALQAITLSAARILGVGDELGSIEVGKSASLILTDGDPLEIRTRIEAEFIDGRPVDLHANRHERLYRKYSSRPRAAVAPTSPQGQRPKN